MNNTPEIVKELKKEEDKGILNKNFNSENKEDRSLYQLKNKSMNSKTLTNLIKAAEKSNAGVLITNKEGTIKYLNEKFTNISGYELEDIIGENIKDFQSFDQPTSFFNHLTKTIHTGRIWTGEIKTKRKNNDTYWQETTIIPINIPQGDNSYFVSINNEITQQKKMQQNLQIKDNAILSSINAIVLTDLSGKITYVNPSFLKMWSFDSEQKVLGKTVFSLWKEGGKYVKIMDTVIQQGGWLGEVIAKSRTGRLFPVQMSASIVKDEDNSPLYIMASFVDITKQKRMEKNYKKFKKISDEADYGSVIYDLQGIILYGNTAFAKMHNYEIEELIGKHISILFDNENKEKVNHYLTNIKKHGKIIGKEEWHISKNKSSFPLLVTSTLIDDPRFHRPFIAGTMIDITKMKQAEQKIIQHSEEVKMMNKELHVAREQLATLNENLERKVKERTSEINKLLKQKDGFINQLGHDLRTPLTPMFALLPLLENKVSDEKGKQYVSMILRNIQYMKDLVNKTITYAKLNSDNIEFNFTEIKLYDFINELLKDFDQYLEENNAIIKNNVDRECLIFADSLQLKEVFQNLLTNAVKYKQKNKPAKIEINSKLTNQSQVTVYIKDDGIGMTKEEIENVFEEFYKADDARSDVDSHGLGLNICKRIIEKHGGNIQVESPGVGKGTTFSFTLKNKSDIK